MTQNFFRRLLLVALSLTLSFAQADPTTSTLVARVDTGKIIHQEGPCDVRNSPASTFKLPLAVMGYDSGLLTSAHAPEWPYHPEYQAWMEKWKRPVDPTAWLKNSVVWYSQVLVQHLGQERFQKYTDAFVYGNRDLSGKIVTQAGLPNIVWVDSSLQISPREQITFLEKWLNGKLPVSASAMEKAKAITPTFPLANGWIVHGKTGTGDQSPLPGETKSDRQFGWFIGWVETGLHTYIFARLIKDDKKMESYAGPRARDSVLHDLPFLIPAQN